MKIKQSSDGVRFWVAKPYAQGGQKIGNAYRLSPHPDMSGWWQLEVDQGNGWRLFRVREKAEIEEYLRDRDERGAVR